MPRVKVVKSDIMAAITNGYFDIIGNGAYGVVISLRVNNRRFAVKIGSIPPAEYATRRMLMNHRLAPAHYAYYPDTVIPNEWVDIFDTWYKEDTRKNLTHFLLDLSSEDETLYTADIMVMDLAEPLIDGCSYYGDDDESEMRADRAIRRLKDAAYAKCGYYWADCHSGNVGVYRGYYVILDPNVMD